MTKRAAGRDGDTRFSARGCPGCRGTLEWLAERDFGSLVMFRWHRIDCGRDYSGDTLSLVSSQPSLAGTGTRAGPFDAFSSKPAGLAPGKARTR